MKHFFLILILLGFAGQAFAAPKAASGASVQLPITTKIVNLTLIPLDEAIAFCDQRAMECPALREKYEEQEERRQSEARWTK